MSISKLPCLVNTNLCTMSTGPYFLFVFDTRLHMLRELEEAVQRKFHVPADGSDSAGVANDWESRLHISQV